ncbi:MAG: prepilin-type N-terminal cleavage/methylation domain-containing protein [Parcubacteria group bacterium Gr01-1014_8]|nr:MAG: prepilin-type N-terminal cleavage/methylation domain-containing protein [Parcubacteria group bacterium Gr01-1014_8]
MNRTSRGFTLIELLVVIAIIGILSSVVLASLNSARKKGRDARRIADMKQMQLALELYYDAHQSYPAVVAGGVSGTTDMGAASGLGALVTEQFISQISSDPTNSGSYVYSYASADGAGAACTAVPCSSYVIKSVIEGGASAVPLGDVDGLWAGLAGGATTCDDPSYCVKP